MDEHALSPRLTKWSLALLITVLGAGIFLRAWPSTGFGQTGYDEGVYARYVKTALKEGGVSSYPELVIAYVQWQKERPDAVVPPTRLTFLVPAVILAEVFNLKPLTALHGVALASSILLLLATAVIGYRLGDTRRMLVLTALMAVAPLQIHLAQRSLVDGCFAFWAVLCAWFLWESLQAPARGGWLLAYGASLFALVLTKENAAFVFLALLTVSVVFALFKLGRLNWPLIATTVIAPGIALLFLTMLVGGIGEWISFYRAFAQKSATLSYAVRFQDGPWYRYLVDFTLLSPCVVALAFGALFQVKAKSKPDFFWSLFLGASFIAMSSVPYGMSLRFAAYWDLPLRWLAGSEVLLLAGRYPRAKPWLVVLVLVLVLAAIDLFQYWRFFVHGAIYDPVSFQLIRAAKFVK
jgi:4-amino-4-deoxy-L-arabinose transferase-like glycosyltransferase